MNILIYSHTPIWIIHHAETVEIALRHLALGDTVYILSCDGELASCPANAFHDETHCKICKEQTNYTLNKILENKVIDLRLSLNSVGSTIKKILTLNELVEYKLNNIPFGSLVASQLVDDYKDCFISLENKQQRVSKLLINAISLYEQCRKTIKDNDIEKVYVWNGRRSSDGPVCYAAQEEGVDFEVYISGGKKGTYFTLPALAIHDLTANKRLMNTLYTESIGKIGIKAVEEEASTFYKNCRYGGEYFPGFIHFGNNNTLRVNDENSTRRKIVVFTSSYYEYFGMAGYTGGCYSNHYEGIVKILNDENIYSQYDLIVRWHPNLKNCGISERKIINKIISTSYVNTKQYTPESKVDSYGLMELADVVITFGSTIGIEANFYGKPSILLGRAIYEDTGACYIPGSHEQLVKLLNSDLSPHSKTGAIKHGFYARNYGQNKYKYLTQIDSSNFSYNNKSLLKPRMRTIVMKFLKNLRRKLLSWSGIK